MDNQTDEQWLRNASHGGTGIFVFSTRVANRFNNLRWHKDFPESPFGAIRKGLVPDVDYLLCVRLAIESEALALKWIPDSIAQYHQIEASASRCASFGCICTGGLCI